MLKIRDPVGLIEQDAELQARVLFFEKLVKPICLACIILPVALFVGVLWYELFFKHKST